MTNFKMLVFDLHQVLGVRVAAAASEDLFVALAIGRIKSENMSVLTA